MLTDDEKDTLCHYYHRLTSNLPGFRPRPAQRQMLAEVAHTFARSHDLNSEASPAGRDGESIVVIEGPPGVGKSLAYLLAGGVLASSRHKKLIVASATVALQEQLIHRDLPWLTANSGLPLTFALAKGRGRYLCPYKLYQLTAHTAQAELLPCDTALAYWDRKPHPAELASLHRLADAFHLRQWNGDRDVWPHVIDDALWGRVTNDRHGCLKTACPNRVECPFFLARDALEVVDIVVANHDLLLADIAMGGGVILPAPQQSFYCIDEAHHLAKKAVNQFAAEHSVAQTMMWLDKVAVITGRAAALTGKDQPTHAAVQAASAAMEALTEWEWLLTDKPFVDAASDALQSTWLIDDGLLPEQLRSPAANMALAARMLHKQLTLIVETLIERRKEKTGEALLDNITSEVGFLLSRAEQLMAVWELFERPVGNDNPPIAKWIVRRHSGKGDYSFCASPISAAANLAATLWRQAAGALLTSATLRSFGAFDLLLSQTGLIELSQVTCKALESPFDFRTQGELYLPPFVSSPKDPQAHGREIAQWLPRLISPDEAVGTLVLFASKNQLQHVASLLPKALKALLLVQGDIPKSALLERHRQQLQAGVASVIFGLDSFAEGLDLPGESCVHVIIAKLPFAMPNDPVGRTLSRWIEKSGGNPFIELAMPEASIKLTQAVGRLIRTESDYGRVTILDNRLTRQSYGRRLLAALPPFKRV